ncbi:MAG: hypothetical protein QOE54_7447 [Streptosporangiaceae bacterium]|jgi:hypothetical protein|nr:hypothetical protein [Streptosporangiaceae bacterium]
MHLVSPERVHRRIIDDHRGFETIAEAGDGRDGRAWVGRFGMLLGPRAAHPSPGPAGRTGAGRR